MKNIKAFEDFGSSNLTEGENHHENYMFFQHLMTIKDAIEDLLSMDKEKVDAILNSGHDWANDHITTSVDDIEEVYHFLKNRMNVESEHGHEGDHEEEHHDDEEHDDDEREILNFVTVDDMDEEPGSEEAEDDDDDDEEDEDE